LNNSSKIGEEPKFEQKQGNGGQMFAIRSWLNGKKKAKLTPRGKTTICFTGGLTKGVEFKG